MLNLNLKLRFNRSVAFFNRSLTESRLHPKLSFRFQALQLLIFNCFTDLSMKQTGIMESQNFSKFWGGLLSVLLYQVSSKFNTCRPVERLQRLFDKREIRGPLPAKGGDRLRVWYQPRGKLLLPCFMRPPDFEAL